MARLVALLADLPLSVGGATVNRFCGSSMQSIHIAAGQIAWAPATPSSAPASRA